MYPKLLLREILWGFYGGIYISYNKFIEDVLLYHSKNKDWNPEQVALNIDKCKIQWMYWDEEGEIFEPDELLESNKGFFTEGELLFLIHNKVVSDLENEDKHFFEGLELYEGEFVEEAPLYFLLQGS